MRPVDNISRVAEEWLRCPPPNPRRPELCSAGAAVTEATDTPHVLRSSEKSPEQYMVRLMDISQPIRREGEWSSINCIYRWND